MNTCNATVPVSRDDCRVESYCFRIFETTKHCFVANCDKSVEIVSAFCYNIYHNKAMEESCMFFNSLNRKLKKSYSVVSPEVSRKVFPKGEDEYIYVGTILNTLFKNRDVFELLKVYVAVYVYYKTTMGNTAKTYSYANKKTSATLTDDEVKTLIALVMFNLNASKAGISDPIDAVRQYRGFVDSYLKTVSGIQKNAWRFNTDTVNAGTVNSPLLVDGVCGVRDYIKALKIPGVEEITYKRNSSLHLTDENCGVSYAIDEYKLYNAKDSSEIATLWFNIYGTENTEIQPACFSDKTPFSPDKVASELFDTITKECEIIENIVQDAQIPYEQIKLVTSTFAYFYVIWVFSFKGIRSYQCDEIEKRHTDNFVEYAKQMFENAPYKTVTESETVFKDMLKRVDKRVRNAYHENNKTLIDDGLSKEFVLEFISNEAIDNHIVDVVSKRIFEKWVAVGADADQRYLT